MRGSGSIFEHVIIIEIGYEMDWQILHEYGNIDTNVCSYGY
jgi:hypothetical protein